MRRALWRASVAELKCSANLADAIAGANAKYGPFLSRGGPADFTSRADDRRLPEIDETYRWAPHLFVFALGVWLAVPGESTATMDRLRIPVHEQDRVLCRAAQSVLAHNARIANRRWPAGYDS